VNGKDHISQESAINLAEEKMNGVNRRLTTTEQISYFIKERMEIDEKNEGQETATKNKTITTSKAKNSKKSVAATSDGGIKRASSRTKHNPIGQYYHHYCTDFFSDELTVNHS